MKSYSIKGLILGLAVMLFAVTDTQAQTREDVILAFNNATEQAKNGQNREAISSFERVITLSNSVGSSADDIKTSAQNQIPQLYFLIARDLYNSQNFVGAAEAFAVASEQATKYGNTQIAQRSKAAIPQLYLSQGNTHLKADEHDKALEMYDKALAARPTYAAAYYQKGLVYRQQENLDEALGYFDRAIQIGTSSNEQTIVNSATSAARNFLLLKGVNSTEARQFRTAVELLKQALQYDDTSADVHYRLSEAYNKQALWADAIASANKALELEQGGRTDRAKIYFELGFAQKGNGNYEAACSSFQQAAFGSFRAAAEHEMEHELKCGQAQ